MCTSRRELLEFSDVDKHNARPNAIAEDFDRFGFDVWVKVDAARKDNGERRMRLWAVITWRWSATGRRTSASLPSSLPAHPTDSRSTASRSAGSTLRKSGTSSKPRSGDRIAPSSRLKATAANRASRASSRL